MWGYRICGTSVYSVSPHWASLSENKRTYRMCHTRLDLIHTRLDLIHSRLDLIHTRLDLIHSPLYLIHTRLDHIPTSTKILRSISYSDSLALILIVNPNARQRKLHQNKVQTEKTSCLEILDALRKPGGFSRTRQSIKKSRPTGTSTNIEIFL